MSIYLHNFKFRTPYQTIIDDTITLATAAQSFDLIKGISRTIQDEIKPMITQCCIHKLYESDNQTAISLAKTFERRKCNHKEPIEPIECIQSIVNIDGVNKHRYVIASNNYDLRKSLRYVPGVPMIFMNRAVMVMEPISHASNNFATKVERAKLTSGLNDAKYGKEKVVKPTKTENGDDTITAPKSKKRKGPSGPNPLSVKKKKTEGPQKGDSEKSDKKSRRRKHGKSTETDQNEASNGHNEKESEDKLESKTSGDSNENDAPTDE